MSLTGIPIDVWSGAAATKALHDTIAKYNQTTEAQTRTIIRLTRWMLGLTVVMTAAVLVQIALMAKQLNWF